MAEVNIEREIGALSEKLVNVTDQVKNFAEDMQRKMTTGQAVSDEIKAKSDEALTMMGETSARLTELEQKLARKGADEQVEVKSWGEALTEDEGFAGYKSQRGKMGKFAVEVKAVHGLTTAAGGALRQDQRIDGIVTTPNRRMTVRDLLTPGRTSAQSLTYYRELVYTNSADVVSETTLKPESTITFESETTNVATIAHWLKASKQILSDVPQLQSFIDGRLRYGLAYKEETQLLSGDGTGENLEGLITAATAYSAPFNPTGTETAIDILRLALLQATLAEYPASGIVLHPSDWARIELTKDTEGRYIIGNPQGNIAPTLWGQPVVATQAITVDKFLVGAFQLGAQIFDREDAAVMISDEDGDNFVKNMVTVLAEERLALAIYRPAAFVYGDMGFA